MSIILDGTTGITTPGLTNTGTETLVNLTTTGNTTLGDASTDTLNVGNGGLIKDASGNVGIGVTPSAWSTGKALEIGTVGNAVWQLDGSNMYYCQGTYYTSGSLKYAQTGVAPSIYVQNAGAHKWYYAASGTAGSAVTFTQAMTLDASGNLGVGTTSPASRVDVTGTDNAATSLYAKIYSANRTVNLGFGYQRIETNGDLAVVAGGYTAFTNNGSERARIDTSGNLLVGATSNALTAARLLVQTASDYQLTVNASTSSGAVYSAINFTQAGAGKGAIFQDHANTRLTLQCNGSGGVYLASGATSWTANSDERLKDIIEPITDATNKVSSLRAVIGKYKTDEEGTRRSFLIAQDVQSVLPEAVTSGTLSRSEDTTEYLGVAYTDVIPLLVAAIKEQNQLIQSLTDRISALEQK